MLIAVVHVRAGVVGRAIAATAVHVLGTNMTVDAEHDAAKSVADGLVAVWGNGQRRFPHRSEGSLSWWPQAVSGPLDHSSTTLHFSCPPPGHCDINRKACGVVVVGHIVW